MEELNVRATAYSPKGGLIEDGVYQSGRLPLEERVLLDYVFVSGGMKTNRYRVIQDRPENGFLSDHDPVLVDVILR